MTGAVGITTAKATQNTGETNFSGTITTPDGTALTDAEVILYDGNADGSQPTAQTTTDDTGQFAFNQLQPPSNPFLVVKHSDTGLYRSYPNITQESLTGSPEIPLHNQLLYGPTLADQNTSAPRGIITVWRQFRPENQVLGIEVTGVADVEPPWNMTNEGGLHSISSSFTIPESVDVSYEESSILYTPLQTTTENIGNEQTVENWHPARMELPLIDGVSDPGSIFLELTQDRIEEVQDETALTQNMLGTILGEIPGYSLVKGLSDTYDIVANNQSEITTELVAGDKIETLDPNEFDTASGINPIFALSNVYRIPIQFNGESSGEYRIVAKAGWQTPETVSRDTPNRWQFQEEFKVSPQINISSEESEEPDEQNETPDKVIQGSWPTTGKNLRRTGSNVEPSPPTDPPEIKWQIETNRRIQDSSPAVRDGVVYVGNNGGNLFAIDTETGEIQWQFTNVGSVRSSPAVVDNSVYIGDADGIVSSINRNTGNEQWRFETDAEVRSGPIVGQDTIYVGSNDSNVYALDLETGENKWRFQTDDQILCNPTLANGLVYMGTYSGSLYAIDSVTGEEQWSFSSDGSIEGSLMADENGVYVPSDALYSLHPFTGEEQWKFNNFDPFGSPIAGPTVVDGTAYLGSGGVEEKNVHALDASTGEEKWNFLAEDIVGNAPTVADGTLIFGDDEGNVYALNSETGDELWDFSIGGAITASLAINGEAIIGGSWGTYIFALS
jgi:outer membrane protein assembly factor BamB